MHAPAGSLQERYFCDYGVAALRVMARLRSRTNRSMQGRDVLIMLRATQGIRNGGSSFCALRRCERLAQRVRSPGAGRAIPKTERADVAMVLFISAGCMGSARRRPRLRLSMRKPPHGGRLAATPAVMMRDDEAEDVREIEPLPFVARPSSRRRWLREGFAPLG